MAGTQAGKVGEHHGAEVDKAAIKRLLAKGVKPHRNQLPPLPTCRTKLEDHPMGDMFKEAEQTHLVSHHQMNSWSEIPIKKTKQSGQQILDCMWVYTYKFDKHHRLLKCKARLVVRGDQQRNITAQDTYAATLASRSFRMLTAIAAKHDLELKQYDVTNAFVHATIDREVFMRMPRGYQKPGTVLRLNKALYGLRISPLLWQREFTSTLRALGFQEVPHEPCCLIKDGIIIFFYVDDIILAYHKDMENQAQQAIKRLQDKYLFTGGNDLQWFLGVEIIRDRESRTIQLSQAAYADKISRLADRTDIRHDTPMATAELLPRDGLASPSEINKYQRKIGSLLLQPQEESQGYAIKLFNGLIAWKANKQDTVTTSTTEAELLALSQVAKEALFISRLLKELGIQLENPTVTIQCDNKQTIRLVTEEISKLQTKLRHVDIHNHWIRQEVSTGRISVEYTPTADMIADGLTKALPPNKWPEFLQQLGLVPAETIIARNQAPLEEIQEKLESLVV
ncbi:hypothetical protein P3342_002798 [Pyrenophora teres f. teres]|nr:hypothetical protein P3342_002798 [Pyrenophora teres f. teres]